MKCVLQTLCFFSFFLTSTCYGESIGGIVQDKREIENFHGVSVRGGGNLFIKTGENQELTIEADANTIDGVESSVSNGILYLGLRKKDRRGRTWSGRPIAYHLIVPTLTEIRLAGAGKVTTEGQIFGDSLSLILSGSGTMDINIDVNELDVKIAGSGAIHAKGSLEQQSVKVEGSGSYEAPLLRSKRADVSIEGNGSVLIHVEDALNARIIGTGKVSYRGDPQVKKTTLGLGRVIKSASKWE